MDCTYLQDELDRVVNVTLPLHVFLCLVFGIFLGTCIVIILIVCWIKVFKKGKKCKKICCCCCIALGAIVKKRVRESSSAMSEMILTEWKQESSDSEKDSDSEPDMPGDAVTAFVEDEEGNKKMLRWSDSCVEGATSDTESTAGDRFTVAITDQPLRHKQTSLAALLTEADWEERNTMMFENEKATILKIEEDYIRQKSDLFLFMLDCVATQIVTSERASEDWKESLRDYCENMLIRTKKRTRSHSVANFQSLLPQMPETFQINTNGVMIRLFEHVQKSIEDETEVEELEVDAIVNEFQKNWNTFERVHSEIYIKQIKEISHHFNQKVEIIEVIEEENIELMREMVKHVDEHVNTLKRLQIKDLFISVPRPEDRLAPELEEIWQSALSHFQMDLRRQKIQLCMEIDEELDAEKKKFTTNYEEEIQAIQEEVMNDDGSIEDYIDKYCGMIKSKFKEQTRLEQLETQLTANGFCSLIEAVGYKYLKMALRSEGGLYASFMERTNWIEPAVSNVVTQLQTNLTELQLHLKELRKIQRNRLQSLINKRKESASAPKSDCEDELNIQQKSIEEVIEMQADLSEMEYQLLLDQCLAQRRSFEAQLELNRVKQERRLEQRLRQEKVRLSKSLKQTENGYIDPEARLKATYQLNEEERELIDTHHQSMEELKIKLRGEIEAAKRTQEILFQQKIEHMRRAHERRLLLATKQEKAIKSLKSKLLNKLSNEAEHTVGERIIKEHQITKDVLEETIKRNKLYQQQVLKQKLQARKLDKKQENDKNFKNEAHVEPYRPGSAKRFAANTLVSLLFKVRHNRAVKEMEVQLTSEGERVKSQIERKFKVHSKLELQLREAEMIAKLATALGLTRAELEMELKKSVEEQGHRPDSEYGILLSKSVLGLFDGNDNS